jgi:hypothetical protein
MPQGHRLRLNDGSVIDLDRAGIRSWYESGLISADSQVQKPGSREWTRLGQAMDVRQWKTPAKPQGRSVPAGPKKAPSYSPKPLAGTARPAPRPGSELGAKLAELPWKRMGLLGGSAIALVLAGWATSGLWVPLVLGTEDARRMKAASLSQREVVDQSLGLKVAFPSSWSLLKDEHGLFAPPTNARLSMAAPKEGALAYLAVDTPARAYPTLDAYLTQVISDRQRSDPSMREARREDAEGARRLLATRQAESGPVDEVLSVWKDGWTYYTLSVWAPSERATADAASQVLRPAIRTEGPMGGGLRDAVTTVVAEVPLLTPRAAEALMGQSAAQILEPAEAFRRTYLMTSMGLPSLTKAEQRELGALSTQMYATLPGGERARLGSYIEKVRGRQATDPKQDVEMSRLAQRAALKLPPARRERLTALFEKAVTAGLSR